MPATRSVALLLTAALLTPLGEGCSNTLVSCMDSRCSGCCDIRGICSPGNADIACGVGAALCVACVKGLTCQAGICAGPGGANALCNSSNCVGCCTQEGDCQTPGTGDSSSDACGVSGESCAVCSAAQTCTASGDCANNCTGCIDGTGACVAGDSPAACGSGGIGCSACAPDERCQGGGCVTAPCDASTCPGCCSQGTCVPLAAEDATTCGNAAAACAFCPAGAPLCQNSTGTCVGGACGNGNCNGCCGGAGCVVLINQSNASCGNSGDPCAACSGAAPTCDVTTGTCGAAAACSSATCGGCCVGNSCLQPPIQTSSRCGSGGLSCGSCSSTKTCDTVVGGCVSKTGLPGTVTVKSSGNALPPPWTLTSAAALASNGSNPSAQAQIGTRVRLSTTTAPRSTPCALPYQSGTHLYCDGFAATDPGGATVIVDDYTYLRATPPCKSQLPPTAPLPSLSGVWQDHYSSQYGDVWVLAASSCSDLGFGAAYAGNGVPPNTTDIHAFRTNFRSGGVTLRGVVVAVWTDPYTYSFGFTLEDPAGGPQSGLLVQRASNSTSSATAPKVGDYVAARGNAALNPAGYALLQL